MFDRSLLYPPFARKLFVFEAKLYAAKLPFYPFCGGRNFDEQAKLYAQGRNASGLVIDKTKVVTKAKAGYSYHNYFVAVDYVEDGMIEKPGMQWSWNIKNDLNADGFNDWKQMAEIAINECGLDAGYFWESFPDAPHIQLKGLPKVEILLNIYIRGGLPAVWAELEKSYNFDDV
jgi:hypothetical protein